MVFILKYQYCGPGTKLQKRLKRNDPGINGLDQACKTHDIVYSRTQSVKERNKADHNLAEEAWQRYKSSDASIGEKMVALGVNSIMNVKSKLGFGLKNNQVNRKDRKTLCNSLQSGKNTKNGKKSSSVKQMLKAAMRNAKMAISAQNPDSIEKASELAVDAAKLAIAKKKLSKKTIQNGLPRVIPVPKIGGILPLVPIFAGLSALGALMGGTASVANAVMTTNNAKKKIAENKRHNEIMEAISLGKSNKRNGKGLFLAPYKKGFGLYLNPYAYSKN